jgi:GH25 family lysozyme M1 (1,4-beta-N-acetylmuramidase)
MTIYFPDVSSAQAGISFHGALVVMVKATEGTGYLNPDYQNAKGRALASGSYFNAYHFLHQGNGTAQAQHAYNVVGSGVPLMLDFEPYPEIGSYPTLADAEQFIDEYRRLGGRCHFVYLPEWYWLDNLSSPSLSGMTDRRMLLWSSVYGPYTDASTGAGWLSYGGMSPTVWQYTSSLVFNGSAIDFSAFRGHYAGKEDSASVAACVAEFKALANTGSFPVPVNPNWTFGPVRNPSVLNAGYTSVSLQWTSPDTFIGSPPNPAPGIIYYEISILKAGKVLPHYPRREPKDMAHPTQSQQFGSLPQGTGLTARIKAVDTTTKHTGPDVSVSFTTGTRPAKKRRVAKATG